MVICKDLMLTPNLFHIHYIIVLSLMIPSFCHLQKLGFMQKLIFP